MPVFFAICHGLGIANPDQEADPDHQDPGHDHGIEGEIVTGKIGMKGVKEGKAHTDSGYRFDELRSAFCRYAEMNRKAFSIFTINDKIKIFACRALERYKMALRVE
ncbi:hypothetical protein OUZ56_022585 [Daphnia magna]|uniref:Uncharacterized protein n=1 Tax=Daphnia magna TaxID=35525 RepID=A0ABR0AWU6_9CRUS|nr:hypothetical protein OUZ56_022585 [Daphnia magna]